MIVVSDASPINVLVRIGCIHILPGLYERVAIPPVVARELGHARSPESLRQWIARPPEWLEVRAPASVPPSVTITGGEREEIALALEIHAQLLIVDDRKARRSALAVGVPIIGTIGVARPRRHGEWST